MHLRTAWSCAILLTVAPNAFGTLQQTYLDGYLQMRNAAALEKKGDSVDALKQYLSSSDLLHRLNKDNPDWESKLIQDTIAEDENRMRALPPVANAKPVASSPLLAGLPSAASATPQEKYLDVYLRLNDAERKERDSDFPGALAEFQDCYNRLEQLRTDNPGWETVLILGRLDDCRAKLAELEPRVTEAPAGTSSTTNNVIDLPVSFKANDEVSKPAHMHFKWREGIPTTVFWIGNKSDADTSWNHDAAKDNGGPDDPDGMSYISGYSYTTHASTLNPFYVALPFNDVAHPDEAKVLPEGWTKSPRDPKTGSACQGRWVEIKNGAGRVCYAQWEDVGPLTDDDPDYVFGFTRPKSSRGLDISPAVAKYLGIDGNAATSWRFVDDADVQPGMWLRYDEQAILFAALRQLDNAK